MRGPRSIAIAPACAAVIAVTPAPAVGAQGLLSLTQRVLAANEISGYTPLPPPVKPLALSAFAKAAGDGPRAKRILAKHGFISGAYENVKGPTKPPPGASSSSSVVQFHKAASAMKVLAIITRDYYRHSPGMGIKLVRFGGTGIPHATAARFSKGNVNEYNVLFASGRYFYDVDIFTRGQALTQAQFIADVHSFYERVR